MTKKEEAGYLIHMFAVAHGAVAFLLANTAIVDTVAVSGLTAYMINSIAGIYGETKTNVGRIIAGCFRHYAKA